MAGWGLDRVRCLITFQSKSYELNTALSQSVRWSQREKLYSFLENQEFQVVIESNIK